MVKILNKAWIRRSNLLLVAVVSMAGSALGQVQIQVEEKPAKAKSDIGAGGIYIADSRIFAFCPAQQAGPLDLSYHVLPRMTGKMKAYDSGEFSMDIGTPESLAAAREYWQSLQQDHA